MMKVVDERKVMCPTCGKPLSASVASGCRCDLTCWCCGGELGACVCDTHPARWRVEVEGRVRTIVSCHGDELKIAGPSGAALVRELVQHADVRRELEKQGDTCTLIHASGLRPASVIVVTVRARD